MMVDAILQQMLVQVLHRLESRSAPPRWAASNMRLSTADWSCFAVQLFFCDSCSNHTREARRLAWKFLIILASAFAEPVPSTILSTSLPVTSFFLMGRIRSTPLYSGSQYACESKSSI